MRYQIDERMTRTAPPRISLASGLAEKRGRGRPPKTRIIRIPVHMDFIRKVDKLCLEGNVAENWRVFKQNFDIFATAIELDAKKQEVQVAIFLNTIGPEAVEVFNTLNLSTENAAKYEEVIKAFSEFCKPKKNEVYETYMFFNRRQKDNEPFDNYLMDIKKLVRTCGFTEPDRMLRDRIVLGTNDEKLQKRLLEMESLDLKKAIDAARAAEATKKHTAEMQSTANSSVDAVMQQQHNRNFKDKYNSTNTTNQASHSRANNNNNNENKFRKNDYSNQQKNSYRNNNTNRKSNFVGKGQIDCKFCGFSHDVKKCPSYGAKCTNCGKENHFAATCYVKKVREIRAQRCDDDEEYVRLDEISGSLKDAWYQKIRVQDNTIRMKLDTGAEVNVLPLYYVRQMKKVTLQKCDQRIQAYGGTSLHPVGVVDLVCMHKNDISMQKFVVIDTNSVPILGLKACIELNLVQRVEAVEIGSKDRFIRENKDIFQGLGCFVENIDIKIVPGAVPVAKPARRVPLSLVDRVKEEIDRMVDRGIAEWVDEPMEWVSNLVIVEKKDGRL